MASTSTSFDLSTAVPVDGSAPAPVAKTGAFDLSSAKPVEEDKTDAKSTDKPSDSTDWARQIALAGRAASTGVVGALTLPSTIMTAAANTPAYLANTFFGAHRPYKPSIASAFSDLMTKAGAPVPETSGEQLASAGVSGLTGGLSGGAVLGVPGVANALRSGAAGASGSLSQEGARQIGLPTWVQVGAGLLGSQTPALAENQVRTLGDLIAPLTASGQSRAAGTLLNTQATDPQAAQASLWRAKPLVQNSTPTTGAASQDAGLLGVEKAMRGRSAPEFAQQFSVANAARQAELTNLGGTPKDLQAAIAARSQATAPLYAAAAQQSAPLDNEMIALMQRPAMQSAIARAQKIAADNGETFGMSATAPGGPMALSGRDLQGVKMALDDMRATGFSQGIGAHEQRALSNTTDALKGWMQKNVPAQRQADAVFEDMSAPVNKMTTVQKLQDQASTNTADALTGKYMLSPAGYDKALDNVLAESRNGLGKADIARLEALRKDLQNSTASSLLKAPGSDTFQNLSLNQNIGGGIAGLMTKALSPAYKLFGADSGVNDVLTRAMLDPQFAAGLMQKAAVPRPGLNFRPFDAGTIGGLLGSTP